MSDIGCPSHFWKKSRNFIFVVLESLFIVFRPGFDRYLENGHKTGTVPSGISNGCLFEARDTQPYVGAPNPSSRVVVH